MNLATSEDGAVSAIVAVENRIQAQQSETNGLDSSGVYDATTVVSVLSFGK